ncbi:MAG: DUF4287 domain-containing protein [Ilumatobacteraceae bacterium]|nr:DUF4287 domain-containing protein [Ilumatobacteraceae bacterium]
MVERDPRREAQFPGIEKRTGKPMAHWFQFMESQTGRKYEEQMETLRDEHGFTRAQANALIMYMKGSTSSRRVETPSDYVNALPDPQRSTAQFILDTIGSAFPQLELVIAWNQPMFREGKRYYFGLSAAKNHLLVAPFNADVLDTFEPQLSGLKRNKKTVQVPNDWEVDTALLTEMVSRQLPQ